MPATAEALFDRMSTLVGSHLPPGITPAYYQGFVRRNRGALVAILDRQLQARRNRPGSISRHRSTDATGRAPLRR